MEEAHPPVRIAALIPSRGRPLGLMETVLGAHLRASGRHDVRYVIGCDADDDQTIAMALSLYQSGLPVVPRIGGRQSSLGGLVNQLAEKCPADVYCSLADDVEIQTAGWDAVIADAWRQKPDGVWWWCSQNDATFAIVSEKWRAAAGRIFTTHFPFWYDDLWLIELQRYATGKKGDRIDVWLRDKAPGTHRMRDLDFWHEFFWHMRPKRMQEARAIAEKLGWPAAEHSDRLDLGNNPAFNPAEVQAKQGDHGPPTPEYVAALVNCARTLMAAA